MLPIFCLNPYSMLLGTHSDKEFESCLDDIFLAILRISKKARANAMRTYFYHDFDKETEGVYSFSEYKKNLPVRNRDLAYFMGKIQDIVPYYAFITDAEFLHLSNTHIGMHGTTYADAHIWYFALLQDGCIVSVPLDRIWKKEKLCITVQHEKNCNEYEISNVYDNDAVRLKSIENQLYPFALSDKNRFDCTGKIYLPSNELIYREKLTGRLWYYDRYHDANRKHFEVFDATGKHHLGEADEDGILDRHLAKEGRRINQYL